MVALDNYPYLEEFATEMAENYKYESIGTNEKQKEIYSIIKQRRIKSGLIRGEAGVGKTQIVETLAKKLKNKGYVFFSIDLDIMGAQGNNVFGENIKHLINDAVSYDKQNKEDVVLFIDEVHKIGMDGYESGIDSFKTALARGEIRLLGATTKEEYTLYIEKNKALTDRLEFVDIEEPHDEVTHRIVSDMWQKELRDDEPVNDQLIDRIIEYSRYIPSEANPRKSIRIFDRMIGIYDTQNVALNEALLDKVIFERSGINPNFRPNINHIENELRRCIKGQDDAIDILVDNLNVVMAGLTPKGSPRGSFIFMGPTGVGKTEVAKVLSRTMYESENNMLRYDMSEYQGKNAFEKWKNDVSKDVRGNGYKVILCDEAEKADTGVMDLLLQITSDAILKDRFDREVNFENSFIILTTNLGFKVFEENRSLGVRVSEDKHDTDNAGEILQSDDGKNGFRPELVNRMTGIVSFNALESKDKKEIAKIKIQELKQRVEEEHKFILEDSERTLEYIYKENVSDATSSGGGRDIVNRVRNFLQVPVAKVINRYLQDNERHLIRVKVEPLGELVSERRDKVKSTAKLSVIEYDVLNKDGRIETHKGFNHKDVNKTYDALHEKAEISFDFLDEEGQQSSEIV